MSTLISKDKLLKAAIAWTKKNSELPTRDSMEDLDIYRKDIVREFRTITNLHAEIKRTAADVYQAALAAAERESLKGRILAGYVELAKRLNRPPVNMELAEYLDIHQNTPANEFGSIAKLHEAAVAQLPEEMSELFTSDEFTADRFERSLKTIKKYKRFFISTAVAGCRVDARCFKSMQTYCDENKALPLFLPIADPARAGQKNGPMFFDSVLRDEVMVFRDFNLNNNCYVSNILISAKQLIPTTGLRRLGSRKGTFIYASPKLWLDSVANNHDTPLMLVSPGAITEPDYTTDRYMSNRTAYIAAHDHSMAGIVVELVNDEVFHWRPVQFDSKGRMIDLGVIYDGTKISKVAPAAFVYPDMHVEEMDPASQKAFSEVIDFLQPKAIYSHDTFDGFSINNHNKFKNTTRAKVSTRLDLEAEIVRYVKEVNRIAAKVNTFYEVASNHAERIDRWVEDGGYIKDPLNYAIGHELAQYMLKGQNPLEMAARARGLQVNVKFLKRDESAMVAGIELGFHGDRGEHGSRGAIEKFDTSIGPSITGHSHVPRIYRRAWSVGTAAVLRQGWNNGPSAWMGTCALVYPNGTRQLVNVVGGKWRK